MKCLNCGSQLTGRQRKYCSLPCKNKILNYDLQNYENQHKRGIERRSHLIKISGGGCGRCGYSKNSAALNFHHADPSTKEFTLCIRNCGNRSFNSLLTEVKKCTLLCANCHLELHNPHLTI